MKKALVTLGVLATALVPATASSSSSADGGASASAKRGGFSIAFGIAYHKKQPSKVGNFSYSGVDATCTEGSLSGINGSGFGTGGAGNKPAQVDHRAFDVTYATEQQGGGEGTLHIDGKFRKSLKKIDGTLRVTGDFPNSSRSDCDSGDIPWTAKVSSN